jgi:thiol-disulfide isomerase/thioredoxin
MNIKQEMDTNNLELLVFQGSWCPMCVSAMPHIANFISTNSIDEKRVEIVTVNRTKTEPADKIADNSVTRVPTVILKSNGKEINRITEFAPLGWETELKNLFETVKEI